MNKCWGKTYPVLWHGASTGPRTINAIHLCRNWVWIRKKSELWCISACCAGVIWFATEIVWTLVEMLRFENCDIEVTLKCCCRNVNGVYRIGLFALTDISPSDELTYDYNFRSYNLHSQVRILTHLHSQVWDIETPVLTGEDIDTPALTGERHWHTCTHS